MKPVKPRRRGSYDLKRAFLPNITVCVHFVGTFAALSCDSAMIWVPICEYSLSKLPYDWSGMFREFHVREKSPFLEDRRIRTGGLD